MKLITVSILFICLVAASFSNWFIIFAYNINQNYIAAAFCENKTKPLLHCNGHCYLSKQLAKQEKPATPLNTKSSEKFEIQLFCLSFTSINTIDAATLKTFCHRQQNFSLQQFIASNFHPPQA